MKNRQLYLLMTLCFWFTGSLRAQLQTVKEYNVDFRDLTTSGTNLRWHDQQMDRIDGGYILGGPKSFGSNRDPVLFNITESGDLMGLAKRYRLNASNERLVHVTRINPTNTRPAVQPGYLLSGNTKPTVDPEENFFIRTDNAGNIIWQKRLCIRDGSDWVPIRIAEVKQVSSGKIILVGTFSNTSFSNTPAQIVVMRLNPNTWNIDWYRTYASGFTNGSGNLEPDFRATGIIEDTPGRYIIFGQKYDGGNAGYVLEMQDGSSGPFGEQLHRIQMGGIEDVTSIVKDGDDFIIAGFRNVVSNVNEIFAFRTNDSFSSPTSLDNVPGNANTYLASDFLKLAHVDNNNSQLTFFSEVNSLRGILVTSLTGTPLNARFGFDAQTPISVNGFSTTTNLHSLNTFLPSVGNERVRFTSYSLLGNTCYDNDLNKNPGTRAVTIEPEDFTPLNNQVKVSELNAIAMNFTVEVTEICSECENVPDPGPITTNTGDNILCEGDSLVLTAPAGYNSYFWGYDASTSNTLTITEPGTYVVYLTDSNGCDVTQSITIEEVAKPFIATTLPAPICEGECVDLTATADFYPISWYGPGGVFIGTTSGPFDPLNVCPTTPTTYTATTTDPNTGCSNSVNVDVMVLALPKVTTTLPLDVGCNCDPIQLGAYDTANEEMDWTNGFFTPIGAGGTYYPLPPYINVQTLGSLEVYEFKPCDHGEGDYPITYTYTDPTTPGCTNSETGIISVSNMPTVEIDGVTDLCETGSTTLTAIIGGTSEAMDIEWTKVGVSFVLGMGTTLNVTSTGTYTVTVTNPDHPECTASATVTVTEDGTWHKTTENTTGTEVVNDVVTDAAGNVYVTGTFSGSTEIDGGSNPNITITTDAPSFTGMFVAKYSDCGTLLWVANSGGAQNNTGTSLTLDETNGMVYVTGNLQPFATFYSSQSAGSLCVGGDTESIGTSISSLGGYIAQYDMATGCLYFAEIVEIGTEKNDFRTLTTDESTGAIFVGGSHDNPGGTVSEYYSHIRKYQPTTTSGILNTLNAPVWTIFDNVKTPNSYNVINDLDYDETNDWIHAVGTYFQYVNLFNGSLATETNLASLSDAFLATYQDLGATNALVDLRKGNAPNNGSMTGEGVSESAINNYVFLTGTYDITVNNPYFLGSAGAAPLATSYSTSATNAYMIGVTDLTSTPSAWSSYAYPNSINGSVEGKDVVSYQNRVFFLNEFSGDDMLNSSGCAAAIFTGSGSGASRIGTYRYSQSGLCQWVNYSESTTSNDDHNAMSITASPLDVCFAVGDYTGEMSYNLGAPWSGDLTMTGTPGGYNGHILRIQNSSGAMERTIGDQTNDHTSLKESEVSLIVFPNPANTSVTVKWHNNLDDQAYVQITDITGKIILNRSVSETEFTWKTSRVPNGVYIINLRQGGQLNTEKVIIQH